MLTAKGLKETIPGRLFQIFQLKSNLILGLIPLIIHLGLLLIYFASLQQLNQGFNIPVINFVTDISRIEGEFQPDFWIANTLYSTLVSLLLAQLIPWLTIIYYYEWFYSRAIKAEELIQCFWNIYFKWWSITSIVLFINHIFLILIRPDTSFSTNYSLIFINLSFVLAMILAYPSKLSSIVKYSLLASFITLIFFIFSNFYFTFLINLVILTFFILLSRRYQYQEQDFSFQLINLNRFKEVIMQLLSWQTSKTDGELKVYTNPISRLIQKYKFYNQYLFKFQSLILVALLLTLVIHFLYHHLYGDITANQFVFQLFTGISILLILNPKIYNSFSPEEYILSLPTRKINIYLSQFLQSIFACGLYFSVLLLIYSISGKIPDLNWFSTFSLLLLLIIFGESIVLFLLALFIIDVLFWPGAFSHFFLLATTNGWYSGLFWSGAFIIRIWDATLFNLKQLRAYEKPLERLGSMIGPPIYLLSFIYLLTFYLHPYTKQFYKLSSQNIFYTSLTYPDNVFTIVFLNPEDYLFQNYNSTDRVLLNSIRSTKENPDNVSTYENIIGDYLRVLRYQLNWNYYDYHSLKKLNNNPNQILGFHTRMEKIEYWFNLNNQLRKSPHFTFYQSIKELSNNNLEEALNLAKQSADAFNAQDYWLHEGHLARMMNKHQQAIKAYEMGIKSGNDFSPVTYAYLAREYEKVGDSNNSIVYLKKSVKYLDQNSRKNYYYSQQKRHICQQILDSQLKTESIELLTAYTFCQKMSKSQTKTSSAILFPGQNVWDYKKVEFLEKLSQFKPKLAPANQPLPPIYKNWLKHFKKNEYMISFSANGKPFITSKVDASTNNFATLMNHISARDFRGKRIRFSADLKSKDIVEGAGLWMRVIDSDEKISGFDNMADRRLKGSKNWSHFEIVLDVPSGAKSISYGILLSGKGTVWIDNAELKMVSRNIEVTERSGPQNLNFEDN